MSKSSVDQGPDRRLEMVGSYGAAGPGPAPAIEDELARAERLVAEGERAGLDDIEMGMRLGDMVRICFARQAWAEAVPPLTRLLALTRAQGEDRPEIATVLSSLAAARYALGEHNEAAQLWEEALEIRERWLVPNHFMIARSVENLADARVAQGRMDEALALLRRALAIWQQTLPPSDPTVRAIRTKIGDLQLLSSQELPARGPAGTRPAPAPAPLRLGGYSREPIGPQGVQSSREVGSAPADVFEAPRASGADHSTAGPPSTPAPEPRAAPVVLNERVVPPVATPLVVAPLVVAPLVVASPRVETPVAPVAPLSTFAPPAATALVDSPAAIAAEPRPEGEHRPQFPHSWLQLGRSLALSVPESVMEPAPELAADAAPSPETNVQRSRRAAILAAPLIVVLLALAAAYQLGGSDAPPAAQAANVPLPPRAGSAARGVAPAGPNGVVTVVRQTSAGQVALDGRRSAVVPTSRVLPDETETVARELARTRGGSSAGNVEKQAPRSDDDASSSSLKPLSVTAATQLANAMKAVESTTVVSSDSAVRRMLYGGALSPDADRVTAKPAAPSAPATSRATAEEVQDMRPAMLAPGGVQPVFPFQLLSENVTGNVVIEVLVDANGRADANTARVVRSSHPLFTAAVMRALPTMRFVPAEAHGQKVAQRIEVPFRFDRKVAGQ